MTGHANHAFLLSMEKDHLCRENFYLDFRKVFMSKKPGVR